jgi:hypothetical protein
VGTLTLLRFSLNGLKENGPAVLFTDNQLFELAGFCGTGHVFFNVNDKLHLSYIEAGCSGVHMFIVYDLSGKTPKIVYRNGDLES